MSNRRIGVVSYSRGAPAQEAHHEEPLMTPPLTTWGDPTQPSRRVEKDDPRVTRTRQRVLEVARTLLVEHGPAGLTHSAIATTAGVSRQTLYRYWPTPVDLVAEMVRGRVGRPGTPASDASSALRDHLEALRASYEDLAAQAAYALLIAAAASEPAAEAVLQDVVEDRRRMLNGSLEGICRPVTAGEYAVLVGPITYLVHIARAPVTDTVIDAIVWGALHVIRSES
ncbi:TetR/AcrR family transcriptional regulator [Geodermatophilus sp. SYSU D00965]